MPITHGDGRLMRKWTDTNVLFSETPQKYFFSQCLHQTYSKTFRFVEDYYVFKCFKIG